MLGIQTEIRLVYSAVSANVAIRGLLATDLAGTAPIAAGGGIVVPRVCILQIVAGGAALNYRFGPDATTTAVATDLTLQPGVIFEQQLVEDERWIAAIGGIGTLLIQIGTRKDS